VHIGRSYTISVLSNLNNQAVNFKTFEFGDNDSSWSVLTRIQYVYSKESLYKTIIQKLEEREEIFEDIIDKLKEQRREKFQRNTNTLRKQYSEKVMGIRGSTPKEGKMQSKCSSQYAGYYSSNKSISRDFSRRTMEVGDGCKTG